MKKSVLTLSLLLLTAPAFAEGTAAPAPATAAPAAAASTRFAPAVVAVVDMQKLMQESTAAKSVREQLATRRESYQHDVQADEQKLREAEQKLGQQRSTLTAEQFTAKRRDFEEQVRQVQQRVQERAHVLDVAFNDALATIKQNLGQVVAEAASEKGASLVLDKGQVIVVESSFDITSTVLERLNQKLQRVEVKFPAEGQAQPRTAARQAGSRTPATGGGH